VTDTVIHYCRKCSYIIDGLPENRCPECGQPFDPTDPRTFRFAPRVPKNRALVVLMYLLPLAVSLLFWATQDSSQWVSSARGAPLVARLMIGLWQACGPMAFVLLDWHAASAFNICTCFTVLWIAWITLVCTTRLRNLPYIVHLALGFLWCCSGCPPTGIVIT
jgi:hypothetical protein